MDVGSRQHVDETDRKKQGHSLKIVVALALALLIGGLAYSTLATSSTEDEFCEPLCGGEYGGRSLDI